MVYLYFEIRTTNAWFNNFRHWLFLYQGVLRYRCVCVCVCMCVCLPSCMCACARMQIHLIVVKLQYSNPLPPTDIVPPPFSSHEIPWTEIPILQYFSLLPLSIYWQIAFYIRWCYIWVWWYLDQVQVVIMVEQSRWLMYRHYEIKWQHYRFMGTK
jgi:hypothetical protein